MKWVRYKNLLKDEVPSKERYVATLVDYRGYAHLYKDGNAYGKVQKGGSGFFLRKIKKTFQDLNLNSRIDEVKSEQETEMLKEKIKEILEDSEDFEVNG